MIIQPPAATELEIGGNELSTVFASVESAADSNPARALIAVNRFLAAHAMKAIESSVAESRDLIQPDADLLWLEVVEGTGTAESLGESNGGLFREAVSLARPEERRFIAFAPVADSISCIIASPGSMKFSVSTLPTTGLRELEFRELTVKAPWSQDEDGLHPAAGVANEIFCQIAAERWLLFSAVILGVAQSAFKYVIDYSRKRTTFGRAIGHHQAVALKLADIAIAIESARLLCLDVCATGNTGLQLYQQVEAVWDYIKDIPRDTACQLVQVMGGHGYLQEHPIQQWFCDLQLLLVAGELPYSLAAAVKHA